MPQVHKAVVPPRGRGRPRYDQEDSAAALAFQKIGAGFVVDRADSVPLWVQIKNHIAEAIDRGDLAARSRLPSEQALCEMFAVSRPVIRSAISALSAEGHVIKMPRKGMFVAAPRTETDFITSNLGVFDDLTAKGHEVSVKTFEFRRTAPDEDEKRVFGIPDSGTVIRIGRVYYSDGKPITLTHISLPGHKVPGMEKLDIENRSVFETIRRQYGLTVQKAERWFTAEMPNGEAIEVMGVPPDAPLIGIESIAYDPDGSPLEYYRAFYNPAVARIHVLIDQGR